MFVIFRPDLTMPLTAFQDRMDALVRKTNEQPRVARFEEILIPGKRESRVQASRIKEGVSLKQGIVDSPNEEAELMGIDTRL